MIENLAEYLRSQRTLTAAQVDARAAQRCRYDLTPAERMDNANHHAAYEDARH
jgi:hypothetical protein